MEKWWVRFTNISFHEGETLGDRISAWKILTVKMRGGTDGIMFVCLFIIGEDQCGFKRGRRFIDQVFTVWQQCEEKGRDIF